MLPAYFFFTSRSVNAKKRTPYPPLIYSPHTRLLRVWVGLLTPPPTKAHLDLLEYLSYAMRRLFYVRVVLATACARAAGHGT